MCSLMASFRNIVQFQTKISTIDNYQVIIDTQSLGRGGERLEGGGGEGGGGGEVE